MTRGKIIYINDDSQVYATCEFNGDMHPYGHGEDIFEHFQNGLFQGYRSYDEFVGKLNRKYFGYNGELIGACFGYNNRTIDITDNWTDYLYIINNSSDDWIIATKENEKHLPSQALGIVHYQAVSRIVNQTNEENLEELGILSKKEFVDVMNRLREASDLQEQVNKLFHDSRENIENDFCNAAALQISHENSVVFLLKRIMRDQYEYIDYFIYELDYGRKYEEGMITEADGRNVDIHSSELLYDYILNNGVNCQKEV